MAWSTEYIAILKDHTHEWSTLRGNQEGRLALIKKVANSIRTCHKDNEHESPLPLDLNKVSHLKFHFVIFH